MREVVPLERPVEIVEIGGAAAQQELAQDGQVAVEHLQVARLDEVNPRILKQLGIVEGHDDRILDLNCGCRLDAPRQVLLGGRRVDVPRLAREVLLDVGAFGDEVIADANETPLQPGVTIVRRVRQLGSDARLHGGDQRKEGEQQRDHPESVRLQPDVAGHRSTSFSSNPCARS